MSVEPQESVSGVLAVFDVEPDGTDRFLGRTTLTDGEQRQVVEGAQVLGQAIVAAAKRFPDKSVRSVHAVFARAVLVGPPVELNVDVISEGRSTASAVITAVQNGKRAMVFTVLCDVPSEDLIRHRVPLPSVAPADQAHLFDLPRTGRELRIVDIVDVSSPDEVGPPELHAWVHYEPIPARADLAKALAADFTGHLGIATTMRAHAGIGMTQAHHTVSTAPLTLSVAFHEPVTWTDWLLYSHESTQSGAGMSYVRGTVHTDQGELIASFTQESIIRPMRTTDGSIATSARL